MARQKLNAKKTQKIALTTGLPVVHAFARGGSGHWLVLYLDGGTAVYYHPRTGALEPTETRWKLD